MHLQRESVWELRTYSMKTVWELRIHSVKLYENYAHSVKLYENYTYTVWNCMRIMHIQCETVWQYRSKTKNAPYIWSLMFQYLKFTHMHVSRNKVYVTQAVNIHWKARGCDQLYTGQRDKTNYKIIFFLVHIRKAYRRRGVMVPL